MQAGSYTLFHRDPETSRLHSSRFGTSSSLVLGKPSSSPLVSFSKYGHRSFLVFAVETVSVLFVRLKFLGLLFTGLCGLNC